MIKKIISKALKLRMVRQLTFWQELERKERIKQIDREFKLLKEGLAARQDKEFLISAVEKLLYLYEKQKKFIKR